MDRTTSSTRGPNCDIHANAGTDPIDTNRPTPDPETPVDPVDPVEPVVPDPNIPVDGQETVQTYNYHELLGS
jgi:hypothetical protein